MYGKVFDEASQPVDGAIVRLRSLQPLAPYDVRVVTHDGDWQMANAPAGATVEITASKDGWTTRQRVVALDDRSWVARSGAVVRFGQPVGEAGLLAGADLFLSDFPEVELTEPDNGAREVDPANVILKFAFSEPLDQVTRQRLAESVRLWPADDATGNPAAVDLAGLANTDPGDGLAGLDLDFNAGSAQTSGAIDAGPGGRARVTWDDGGRTMTFAVEGPIGAADKPASYQVGLVSDGAFYLDRQGHALGTADDGLRATPAPAGRLLANVFQSVDPKRPLQGPLLTATELWNKTHHATFGFRTRAARSPAGHL